ncbi:MAG: DNA-binding response regulator [Chloroflexi bacterium]|nr:MAG: DNA-binding response regulator [Chloroflexota bacterium]
MSKFRILLADDHAVLRAGLRMLLSAEPDMEVVGEANDGQQVQAQAKALKPDVILLDLTMPGIDGLTALPILKKNIVPQSRILILTMHEDEAYLRQALQNGAAGYVLKKAVDTELLSAIRAVMRGEVYVHPAMTKLLLNSMLPQTPEPASDDAQLWASLSEREQQVIQGIVRGFTSEEIAEQYFLSVKTVYTYRSRAMAKLHLETRAQLVDFAMRLGIFGEDV